VILLGELRDLKDREIADALGITLEAAKMRLHRARGELRRVLGTSCDLYRDERNELACDRKPPAGS
jgi:RNA polymerase sigma-70 factor (ECF subfamily)